jgi:hypothetical protein
MAAAGPARFQLENAATLYRSATAKLIGAASAKVRVIAACARHRLLCFQQVQILPTPSIFIQTISPEIDRN